MEQLLNNGQINSGSDKPMCLAYCRVSTLEQKDNLSIETQQIKILEKIEALGGYLAEDTYIDNGISGTSMNRPGLQTLLARCSKKDIQYLVVQDISRLSRDTFEYCFIISQLEKLGVKIVPLTGVINDDPVSRTMNEMMAVMNSFFPRMTSYKVKQTALEKFKAGIYPSMAPLGYDNADNPNPIGVYDKKYVIPNPEIAPFVTMAFKMYSSRDYSIFDIRNYLDKSGVLGKKGRKLQFSVTHKILRNSFYWGWMKWAGHEQMGKHTPLIDKPTFNLVQQILSEKGRYDIRKRKHNFLLRGVIFCKDCGHRYVAEWHYHERYKAGNGKIGMYHCSQVGKRGKCPSRYVLLTNLEQQVQEEVKKLQFSPKFVEAVTKQIHEVYDNSIKRMKLVKKAIYNKRDGIEMKREKLEAQLMEGNVGGETFKRLNAKLDTDLLLIQKELIDIDKTRTMDVSIVDEVLELTRNIAKSYDKVDTDHKRAYLHFFYQKIVVKDKKIIDVEFTPAIQALNEAHLGILSDLMLRLVEYVGTYYKNCLTVNNSNYMFLC